MNKLRRTRGVGVPGASPATVAIGDCTRSTEAPARTGAVPPGAAPTRAPVATERQEQAALFSWLDKCAPPGLFYSALPGGDGRMTRTPGYRPGLPDVLLIYRGKPILIEMKRRRGGRLSDHQSDAHLSITHAGGLAVVSYGWDEARQFLEQIIPMRGA